MLVSKGLRMTFSTFLLLAAMAGAQDISVSGVVLSRSGRHAATLTAEGRSRSVVAGEKAFGCVVSSIQSTAVELVCEGERRTVRLAPATPAVTSATASSENVAALTPADVTMSRKDLQARLDQEMSRLITETSLIPVTTRGQIAGFTLSRIPAGTILETLGIHAGDTLVNVNDTPIDSFTTLVGLWPRLQNEGFIHAQIIRDGRPLDISVRIK